jgi:hypothetical protein
MLLLAIQLRQQEEAQAVHRHQRARHILNVQVQKVGVQRCDGVQQQLQVAEGQLEDSRDLRRGDHACAMLQAEDVTWRLYQPEQACPATKLRSQELHTMNCITHVQALVIGVPQASDSAGHSIARICRSNWCAYK